MAITAVQRVAERLAARKPERAPQTQRGGGKQGRGVLCVPRQRQRGGGGQYDGDGGSDGDHLRLRQRG